MIVSSNTSLFSSLQVIKVDNRTVTVETAVHHTQHNMSVMSRTMSIAVAGLMTSMLLVLLLLVSDPAYAFNIPAATKTTPITTSSRLSMINVFGQGKAETKQSELPKDVKDAISKCRGAVQKGLENRISRMDVEMPVGALFQYSCGQH